MARLRKRMLEELQISQPFRGYDQLTLGAVASFRPMLWKVA
jgi:hypothetical protein